MVAFVHGGIWYLVVQAGVTRGVERVALPGWSVYRRLLSHWRAPSRLDELTDTSPSVRRGLWRAFGDLEDGHVPIEEDTEFRISLADPHLDTQWVGRDDLLFEVSDEFE